MAITFGFFNSEDGDRKYTAAQVGDYLQGLVTSGVFADNSSSLQVLAGGGMTVTVQPGRALLNFKFLKNDAPLELTLAAGGAQDRVDAIVAYMDLTERACGITVKQGTPAATPKAPDMTRTDVRKEYALAKVYVKRLTNSITQSNITDTRADTTVCGWVTGLIDQVDTSTLFLQWQTAYEEAYAELGDYLASQQAAWETFFASVTEDNVLPAPALHDARKVPAINDTGDGYELIDLVSFANSRNPVNLLDNSDFNNPINQRCGKDWKATSDAGMYSIDRWKLSSGMQALLLDTITLSNNNASIQGKYYQIIEKGKIKGGEKYTLVVKVNETTICSGVVTAPTSADSPATIITSVPGMKLCLECNTDSTYSFVFLFEPQQFVNLEWAALYEGEYTNETLPPYRPKGYAAELLECRRYYQRINPGYIPFGFGWSNNTTPAAIRVTVPCSPMRIQPTVKFSGTLSNVRLQFDQGAVKVTSVDSVHYRPEAEYMAIFMKPDTVYVGSFVAYCISDYEIFELSADL